MIKKYCKGSSTNPEGVIKALENLGGINGYHITGDGQTSIYYIDKDNCIDHVVIDSSFGTFIMECFEEIQPSEPTPKVFTNLDITRWYFKMIHDGHAVQFADLHDNILSFPQIYKNDDIETGIVKVRIDFGEWIPIEETSII